MLEQNRKQGCIQNKIYIYKSAIRYPVHTTYIAQYQLIIFYQKNSFFAYTKKGK